MRPTNVQCAWTAIPLTVTPTWQICNSVLDCPEFSHVCLCSDLIWQTKCLFSLNWQVLKVLIVKFQVSTLDQCSHWLINLSCKSTSKPLNAMGARSAVCFCSQYCSWARSHRGQHYDCASYTVFTRFGYTPTQHVQPKPNSHFNLRRSLPK